MKLGRNGRLFYRLCSELSFVKHLSGVKKQAKNKHCHFLLLHVPMVVSWGLWEEALAARLGAPWVCPHSRKVLNMETQKKPQM